MERQEMNLYFVVTAKSKMEIEVIKEVKPPKILVSYFYFRNRPLKNFIEQIGYHPEIMLDSGAYSAWTSGRNISPIDYMNYIDQNKEFISQYVALDVMGDADLTRAYYQIMKSKGYSPIPVFHYDDDIEYLQWYVEQGERYIALGSTVPVADKSEVVSWVKYLWMCFPYIEFHLLGSSHPLVLQCAQISSCDSSSWAMMAVNGKPHHIPGKSKKAKVKRAIWWMKKFLGEVG
jgi:hypothetical protein